MRLIRLLKRDMARECSDWVQENIITEQQAIQICHRYGIDFHKISEQSLGYAVLIGLGYLFIGLAVITLVSANWDQIPRVVRMGGLIFFTLATHGLALNNYHKDEKNLAIGLFFLGSLFYGASIMLIAQIYHIDEHFPNGILWWSLGILPLAVLLGSNLLMMLLMALAFTWFFVESSLNYYPILFPLFLSALGWHIFRVKESYILFLAFIFGVGLWLEYTLAWYMAHDYDYYFDIEHLFFALGYFLVLHGFSKWLNSSNQPHIIDYGTILELWVLRFAILFLLVFSFIDPWEGVLEANWANVQLISILAILLSMLAIGFAFFANRQFHSTLIFSTIYLITIYLMTHLDNDLYAIFFQISTNIVLIALGVWLIMKAIQENITHYFFLGVSSILLTGLMRYIDLVGDYVGAAILFIIFAVILLSAARFWKTHKQSIGTADAE